MMIKQVLVVGTNPRALRFLQEKLNGREFHTITSYGGDMALAMLKTRRFDFIIASLEMPHPHGIDLIYAIRKTDEYVPILLISRKLIEGDRVRRILDNDPQTMLITSPIHLQSLYGAMDHLMVAS